MLKRYFTKIRFTLFTILSLLSLISVGFASWTITALDVYQEVSGSLGTDNIIDTLSYIDFNDEVGADGIEYFKYYDTGYIYETDDLIMISGEASIKANFNINLARYKEDYQEETSIQIIITINQLSNSDFDIFALDLINDEGSKIIKHEVNHSVIVNPEIITFMREEGKPTDKKSYEVIIELNDILLEDIDTIPLIVQFNFNSEIGTYFKNNIFDVLKDGFSINAKLKGVHDNA